ncbi:hypothetical protein QOT17_018467 [Balamuthia mandrillaris]
MKAAKGAGERVAEVEWNGDEEETETKLNIETITVARLQAVISKTKKKLQPNVRVSLWMRWWQIPLGEEQERVTGLQVDELRRSAAVLVERKKARWCGLLISCVREEWR